MSHLTFQKITSLEMQTRALFRYEVWIGSVFIGEVFQFRAERYAGAVRWLAQAPDGTITGWTVPIRTRQEAAQWLAGKT